MPFLGKTQSPQEKDKGGRVGFSETDISSYCFLKVSNLEYLDYCYHSQYTRKNT